jgi:hypothetical protein
MINPEVKSRINKIDFELKAFFENVYIKEKYYKTGYFEISANKVAYLKESKDYRRLEAKVIINQPDLLEEKVKWTYSTNPLSETSMWIDRISDFETISEDIINIVNEKRLSEDYIFNLEPIVDVINEDVDHENLEKEFDAQDSIFSILEKYGVDVMKKETLVHSVNENFLNDASDRLIKFYHNTDLKISDKFKIESEMLVLENVNWCLFKEDHIEINYTPSF